MRMTPAVRVGLALLACGVLTACAGGSGPASRSFVGRVTVVASTSACVGGPSASGECFVRDRFTRSLHVGDCVRVTYKLHDSEGPSTASKIEHLDASTDAAHCPRQ